MTLYKSLLLHGQVCRHHAAAVASGCGVAECLVCPYHGWTYGLDGRLRRAPDMRGAQDFQASTFSLAPLRLETWGHLIFVNFGTAARQHPDLWRQSPGARTLAQQLGPRGKAAMEAAGMTDAGLVHVASRQYRLRCNWKVFVDNYLVRQHPAGSVCVEHTRLWQVREYRELH
jgi:choline monooxygenase